MSQCLRLALEFSSKKQVGWERMMRTLWDRAGGCRSYRDLLYPLVYIWSFNCEAVKINLLCKEMYKKPPYNSQKKKSKWSMNIWEGAQRHWSPGKRKLKSQWQPWLVRLSGLSASLWTQRSLARLPVRARAWAAGQVPRWGPARGSLLTYLSHTDASLPLSLPSLLSKKNK